MAKITVNGDALTIATNITVEQYEKVMNYSPDLLKLKDEEGNEFFRVAYTPFVKGECSKYGITLTSSTPEGKMFLTTENVVIGMHTSYEEERTTAKGTTDQRIKNQRPKKEFLLTDEDKPVYKEQRRLSEVFPNIQFKSTK